MILRLGYEVVLEQKTAQEKFGKHSRRALKKGRRFLRSFVEVTLLVVAGFVVSRLSRKTERRLARVIGTLMRLMGRESCRIARANLDVVYGSSKTATEKTQIMFESFNHAALVLLDYFWFSRRTEERVKKHCRADEMIEQWITGDFPGIFVTAHIGNWELGGQYTAFRGRAMWSVYRPIGTQKTLRTLLKFRQATGQNVIAREGAMMNMMRALRSKSIIALLLDQHTELVDGGLYLDFFGLPAAFSNAAGVLSHRLRVPVCTAGVVHDPEQDLYRISTYRVISGEESSRLEPEAITREIVSAISRMILEHPEQWLWSYRRWKRFRVQDDATKFPFYAKLDSYG